ncbi:DNA adenine methylase [Mycoplasma capricolum]|uniref:site-specific DNA-methyltransferase (adenine-specific) n=2 Tax=Mycoplasma capricolum subsp. capricolum TaxID=40479 RepID=A0A0C2ZLE4_MYCCA|nr:DNA adenine methylase [Mycoplasma capricolum]ABC01801.1 adenine-specific DNA methylase, putative [Mycoplasma capricolum subsp. capricolum ATCC 27343]KIM13730.1 adenine-specific DNA methylase [Mycoplasma capricolum subsp. capricolum]
MRLTSRRYIGSKAKLLDWIFSNIDNNVKGNSFFDIFAGTGCVIEKALTSYDSVIINDILSSNKVVYDAFWGDIVIDIDIINKYKLIFNSLDSIIDHNYFSINYGGKYFGVNDSKKIGYIRELIENDFKNNYINKREKNILLASLIYSIDKIANTVGHYEAYRKIEITDNRFKFDLIDIPNKNVNKKVEIYKEDANRLARKIYSDIVFVDPPYNSRQYSRFYHVIENLVEWKKPELFGIALKPAPQNMSEYCRNNAPAVFDDLISNLNCKYIVVTYNNTYNSKSSSSKNKIKLEEILNSLNKRGKTQIFSSDHRFFNAGKTSLSNHKEYLFITEVTCEK